MLKELSKSIKIEKKVGYGKITWDEYFMKMVAIVRLDESGGCVIVKNGRILANDCDEQAVVCQAARFGVSLEGATIYCGDVSCVDMIIDSGIVRVVCGKMNLRVRELFKVAGVEVVCLGK